MNSEIENLKNILDGLIENRSNHKLSWIEKKQILLGFKHKLLKITALNEERSSGTYRTTVRFKDCTLVYIGEKINL